jgi:hypothetical protein
VAGHSDLENGGGAITADVVITVRRASALLAADEMARKYFQRHDGAAEMAQLYWLTSGLDMKWTPILGPEAKLEKGRSV